MILDVKRIKIAEIFLLKPEIKITASQIAKDKKLNQKSTSLILDDLETKLILKSEAQGKNKLFYLNKENPETIKQYLCAIEHLRTLIFYEENTKIKIIIEKINPYLKGTAIIFGSYAKGTQKETSDLDIYLLGKHDFEEINKISKTYNIDINIKEQKKLEINTITKEIIKNHIIIKNTETFINTLQNTLFFERT
ncbi:MAG: nucleotidyltransferase domain-containing protein [Candidatus Woesearchaeota archaeon]